MFETNFGTIDWVIVAVYLAAAVGVGVLVNKYIHNISDYLVGGRASGTALNTATFIGTGLGLVTIMYASMDGFAMGFAYMILALIGVGVGLVLGSTGFVVSRLRKLKMTTIPEYFQIRYNRRVRATAGLICAVAGILNMGLFPKMGATFITYATGLGQPARTAETEPDTEAGTRPANQAKAPDQADRPGDDGRIMGMSKQEFTVNIITSLLILLVLLYTVLGGMVSVIVTDYMQFVVLALGLGVGLVFCLTRADLGWDGIVSSLSTHRGEKAFNPFHEGSYTWWWVAWMGIHVFAAGICWAPEATRALTSRSTGATRRTFLFGMPGQYVRLALPALFGIAAFVFIAQTPELVGHFFPEGLAGKAEHPGQAMPLLLGKIIPTGLLGLLVAGLMAAFMSTHDSYFLCWSSVITRDVVQPILGRELTDRQQIRLTRILVACIGVFLLAWGIWFPLPKSVWDYMAVTGSVWLCGSVTVLVGGMFWKRASSTGAMVALFGGLLSVPFIFKQATDWGMYWTGKLIPLAGTNSFAFKGLLGLVNYALCVVLFVLFSLLVPDTARQGEPQEA